MKPLTIHHTQDPHPDTSTPDIHQDLYSMATFGFWTYLMTDCILFATLFFTYAVLHPQTFGGPTSQELFSLPLVFLETMILLISSVTCGFSMLAARKTHLKNVLIWLIITFLLGISFVAIEFLEFRSLIEEGHSFKVSAFLSAFFTLVGTHGLHVSIGIIWILVLGGQLFLQGLNVATFRRLALFSMYWHFLDLIWIFIFTFVYLRGVIP